MKMSFLVRRSALLTESLAEGLGDYSMGGARRADAPGNIRDDQLVRNYRRNIFDDLESEELEYQKIALPTAAIILVKNTDNKFLGISRPCDGFDMNLPGGSVEEGESFEAAARRELQEETGLIANYFEKIFEGSYDGKRIVVFSASDISGNLRSSAEGVVSWVDAETLELGSYGSFFKRIMKYVKN